MGIKLFALVHKSTTDFLLSMKHFFYPTLTLSKNIFIKTLIGNTCNNKISTIQV